MEEGEWRCRSYLGCLAAPKNVQSTCSIFMHASLLLQSGYLWIWINFGLLAYMATTYLYMWKPAPHWHKLIFKPSLVLLFFFFFQIQAVYTEKSLQMCVFVNFHLSFRKIWKCSKTSQIFLCTKSEHFTVEKSLLGCTWYPQKGKRRRLAACPDSFFLWNLQKDPTIALFQPRRGTGHSKLKSLWVKWTFII